MALDLTISSEREYQHIRMGHMTPAMAAEYLREGNITLRTFPDVLRRFYPAADLQERLVREFMEDGGDVNRASVSRTVRNWLTGRNRPSSRLDLYHIGFALQLSEVEVDYLLGFCTGYGIHYRESLDLVYSWFLRHGRRYVEAEAFFRSLPPQPSLTALPPACETGMQLTQQLRQEFMSVRTEAELEAYYLQNLENFGTLHLRAWHYFRRYMDQLIHPSAAFGTEQESDYSLEAVMERYLSLHMPSGSSRRNYSVVQKLIKNNWPSTTRLKNIRQHREDVPRKLLLLLYVVTENLLGDEYNEMDEEYITVEERLEDHWYGLNAILTDCGMPLLDPRAPFDWLVLYALAADDEPMSERMEQVIAILFEEDDQSSG